MDESRDLDLHLLQASRHRLPAARVPDCEEERGLAAPVRRLVRLAEERWIRSRYLGETVVEETHHVGEPHPRRDFAPEAAAAHEKALAVARIHFYPLIE